MIKWYYYLVNTIIRRFVENINRLESTVSKADVFVVLLIVTMSVSAFCLGILYEQEKYVPEIIFSQSITPLVQITPQSAQIAVAQAVKSNGRIMASKNGKRYYFSWCTGAEKIAVKNRIYFTTEAEAQSRGLTVAKGCTQ